MPTGDDDASDTRAQLASSARLLALSYAATALVVGAAVLGARIVERPFSHVTHDPLAVAQEPFYVGALSNAGVLIWWTAGVVCLVAAAALWKVRRDVAGALAAGGIFGAVLAADDLFMVHDVMLPDYLGIPEPVSYAAYGAAATVLATTYRHFLQRTPWPLLVLVAFFFACSAAVDLAVSDATEERFAGVEDVFKIFGIVTWAVYWVPVALRVLRERTTPIVTG